MEFEINYNSVEKSNLFLRALWANLRGGERMGWQTMPFKDSKKQIIELGNVSSSMLNCLYSVKLSYKVKGCIKSIIFEPVDSNKENSCDYEKLGELINNAKKYNNHIKTSNQYTTCKTLGCGIDNYGAEDFEIISHNNTHFSIIIKVQGFDEKDIGSETLRITSQIIDFLSTQISKAIYHTDIEKRPSNRKGKNDYIHKNWVDDYPVFNKKIRLLEPSTNVISKVISKDYCKDFEKYLDACRLYHTATKYKEALYSCEIIGFNPEQHGLSFNEVANMLYMSSFEVLASIVDSSTTRCNDCGQQIFSIRQKVIRLIEQYSDGYMDKRIIDNYYKKRSAYVHSGEFLGNRSYYGGVSNPQIDKSDLGVISQIPLVNLIMLKEIGGYIFRRFLNEYFNFK